MIKLRDLQYLLAVNDYKHFGKAADACFVSQPTLSGQLKKLEEQLGVTLIERSRHNVMLTLAGEQLIGKARDVVNAAEAFEQTAKTLTDPLSGELHLGLIPTLAPYLLPHIMPALSQQLPKMQFYLHENQTDVLIEQLRAGRLDVLILPWLPSMEGLVHEHLFNEPLVLAMPEKHKLAGEKNAQLKQLAGEQVLVLEQGHCLREQSLDYCFTAGADEDKRFKATSLETLRHMVAGGLGITLLPQLAVNDARTASGIVYRPFVEPAPHREIALVTRPQFPRQECVGVIRDSIQQAANLLLAG